MPSVLPGEVIAPRPVRFFRIDQSFYNAHSFDVDAYHRYLDDHAASLPESALQFARADWHYDFSDDRCPHDSMLDAVTIRQDASYERPSITQIEVRLLSAHGGQWISLRYRDVQNYAIAKPDGYWAYDEIIVLEEGLLHEIRFDAGPNWEICCRDIEVSFQATTT